MIGIIRFCHVLRFLILIFLIKNLSEKIVFFSFFFSLKQIATYIFEWLSWRIIPTTERYWCSRIKKFGSIINILHHILHPYRYYSHTINNFLSVLTILLTVLDPGNIYYCDSCELIAYSFIPLYLKNCECIILYAKNEYAEKGRAVLIITYRLYYAIASRCCVYQQLISFS